MHIIKCPWCKTNYTSVTLTNCKNCGGTLEYSIDASQAGSKPNEAPRPLPAKFKLRIKYTGNVMTIIGIIFTIPFFWTVLFPIIGIFCWKRGIREANDELIPLEFGTPVLGEIESVKKDYSRNINGRSPFIVEFLFEANGQKHRGLVGNIFDNIRI